MTNFFKLARIEIVRANELKKIAGRQPFRPFGLRLSNGAEYLFDEPRQFGAPQNFRTIFYFGESEWVLIDADNITEIFQRNGED